MVIYGHAFMPLMQTTLWASTSLTKLAHYTWTIVQPAEIEIAQPVLGNSSYAQLCKVPTHREGGEVYGA